MDYILPDDFIKRLRRIGCSYEINTGVDLHNSLQPSAVSCFFGAKNVNSRTAQLGFIKKCLKILNPQLKADLNFTTDKEQQDHIRALRVLISVCLFVCSQNSSRSELNVLIKDIMQLANDNPMDERTRSCCLVTAQSFIKKINKQIPLPFDDSEWHKYSQFVSNEVQKIKEAKITTYPITNILRPLITMPLRAGGYSAGYVISTILNKSPASLALRLQFYSVATGAWCLVRGSSPGVAVLFISASYADKFLENVCGITMSMLLATAAELTGELITLGVGLPLDISCRLLKAAVVCTADQVRGIGNTTKITGWTLTDGQRRNCEPELKIIDPEYLSDLPDEVQKMYHALPATNDDSAGWELRLG